MTDSVSAPTSRRIESLDFIRGCALFGILIMNIVGMGLGPAYDNPTIMGGDKGIDLWTWFVVNVTFEGTQRGLFSILFGAGVILFTSRPDSTDAYFRRNLWLIAFGLFNAWILLWGGDILYFYGLTALFLFAFRNLPGKNCSAWALHLSYWAQHGPGSTRPTSSTCMKGRSRPRRYPSPSERKNSATLSRSGKKSPWPARHRQLLRNSKEKQRQAI